jgi:ferredoxin/flavodoxin
MKILLIFCSPNGTTRTTANLLKNAFLLYGHEVKTLDIGRSPWRKNHVDILQEIRQADVVGFGSPAYHMDFFQPMLDLFKLMAAQTGSFPIRAFFFLPFGGITTGKAFLLAARQFRCMQIPVIGAIKIQAPHFHHKQPFPAPETEHHVNNFVSELENKKYAPIPWQVIEQLFKPFTPKVHVIRPLIHWVGKLRELPIVIDADLCTRCGKCIRECPAGAIHKNGHVQIEASLCLHCYHCVAACPKQAIDCPVEKLDAMMQRNIQIIGQEIPANQIYV